ncbi:MAG: hypothetical protein R2776_10135 [Flavobacteriaceae bacterium]|nr:hypothetical protein [Flavobacteriaceae bacterium]
MKLLIITAIQAFQGEVKKLLKEAEVVTYSYKEVIGYRDSTMDSIENNWFGSEMNENESVLFYAFIKKEKVDVFFNLVEKFNTERESKSIIHVASINIEKTNS